MKAADMGARITLDRDPQRPGWLKICAERSKRTRCMWLAEDEAAQLQVLLDKHLPPVSIRRSS